MRQYCKCSNGAELRAILMPLGRVPFSLVSFLGTEIVLDRSCSGRTQPVP